MNSRSTEGYTPPENRAQLELRYAAGERYFPNTDLSGESLVGIKLDGADFEKHSWFFDADFSRASLRGVSFRGCNLKCVNFSAADLTGAILELAAIESIKTNGATLSELKSVAQPSTAVSLARTMNCRLGTGKLMPEFGHKQPFNFRRKAYARKCSNCAARNGVALAGLL